MVTRLQRHYQNAQDGEASNPSLWQQGRCERSQSQSKDHHISQKERNAILRSLSEEQL